jgi:PAS domain S-box-containing protein
VYTSKQPVGGKRPNAALRVDEQRWRQLFGNAIVGITVIDSDFRFVDASATFQKMVGYSAEELRRFTPLDISIEEERELNRTLFSELRQGLRQNYQIVKRLKRKDGGVIWVRIYAFAVHATYASQDMHIALVVDITESKNAEQALFMAQAELGRLSRFTTMGTITASIAHEINQPLAAIITHGHAGIRWLSRATRTSKKLQWLSAESSRTLSASARSLTASALCSRPRAPRKLTSRSTKSF